MWRRLFGVDSGLMIRRGATEVVNRNIPADRRRRSEKMLFRDALRRRRHTSDGIGLVSGGPWPVIKP
jgi:hypothetical protein